MARLADFVSVAGLVAAADSVAAGPCSAEPGESPTWRRQRKRTAGQGNLGNTSRTKARSSKAAALHTSHINMCKLRVEFIQHCSAIIKALGSRTSTTKLYGTLFTSCQTYEGTETISKSQATAISTYFLIPPPTNGPSAVCWFNSLRDTRCDLLAMAAVYSALKPARM